MCVEGLEEGDLDGKHNGSTLKNTGSRIRMWPLQQLLLQEQSGHHFHFVPLGDLAQEKVQGNNYCFISQTRIVWREDNLINSRQFFSAHFMLQLQLADRLPCCNGPWDSPLHRPALTVFSEGSHRYLLNLKSNFLIHPIPASTKTGLPKSDGHVAFTKEINNDLTTFFPCRFMPNKPGQTQG